MYKKLHIYSTLSANISNEISTILRVLLKSIYKIFVTNNNHVKVPKLFNKYSGLSLLVREQFVCIA